MQSSLFTGEEGKEESPGDSAKQATALHHEVAKGSRHGAALSGGSGDDPGGSAAHKD